MLSRCQIIPLKLLTTEEVCSILRRAIRTDRHLRAIHVSVNEYEYVLYEYENEYELFY